MIYNMSNIRGYSENINVPLSLTFTMILVIGMNAVGGTYVQKY